MMTEQLKPAQREQRHEIARVQAVRRRVKTAVKRNRCGDAFGQFRRVGAIGDKAAPFEFFQDAHASQANLPREITSENCGFFLIVAAVTVF